MKIRNREFSLGKFLRLALYYGFARKLPSGHIGKNIRYYICRGIFKECGRNVNIEHNATFGSGLDIVIGENSGIGINANIPSNTVIGRDGMMGPNCYILASNHDFSRTDIPMIQQGLTERKKTIIEDDVWIGRDVTFTPGRTVKRGSIIAAGCVLSKDFAEYSIIGGNPSRLIRTRK